MVSSLEKKIDETEKKFEETSKVSEERLKQALDAESKMIKLKTDMQRSFECFLNFQLYYVYFNFRFIFLIYILLPGLNLRVVQLYRLEEKIFDMESENKILRKQSLLTAPVSSISEITPVSVNQVISHLIFCVSVSL